MERVRRFARNGIPSGHVLTGRPPFLTADQARGYGVYFETSPLYHHLNEVVASDRDLLGILNSIDHTPRQNILYAGIQFLLFKDRNSELAAFYPNLTEEPRPIDGIDGPLKEFVFAHSEELIEVGRTRYTQTNEPRRCIALVPAIWATPATRFHLIDFGTSAGLNLALDHYSYRWDGVTWGSDPKMVLTTDMRGEGVAPRNIEVLSRTGLDLNPVDVHDSDERLWLEALIWPEHHERRERLVAAMDIVSDIPLRLVAGDALRTLPEVLYQLPESEPAVVINSFILNQFDRKRRGQLSDLVEEARRKRPVYRVSMEWLNRDAAGASLSVDDGSGLEDIGLAQPHGEWLDLYARP